MTIAVAVQHHARPQHDYPDTELAPTPRFGFRGSGFGRGGDFAQIDDALDRWVEADARHLLGAHTWGVVGGIELVQSESPTGEVLRVYRFRG